MSICICCHDHLLRHINNHRVYWFCPTCYQEMPNIESLKSINKIEIPKNKPKTSELILNSKKLM